MEWKPKHPFSPPTLPSSVSFDPRNNALGDALEYMKEVEAWGGGVSRYFIACAASWRPPPTVSEEAGFFKVVFCRQTKGSGVFDDTSTTTAKTTAETADENPVQGISSGAALTIWKLICKNPAISISALAADDRPIERKLESIRFFNSAYGLPTNAAVLLFGKDSRRFFPGAYVQYVSFDGRDKAAAILNEHPFKVRLCECSCR